MRKKILITCLSVSMIAALAGCGSSDTDKKQTAVEMTAIEQTTETSNKNANSNVTASPNVAASPVKSITSDFAISQTGTLSSEAEITACGGAFLQKDDQRVRLLNMKGEPVTESYAKIEKITGNFYSVNEGLTSIDDVNKTGIVDANGQVILKPECFMISPISEEGSSNDSDRYIKVFYATETTKDKDECLVYLSDSMFTSLGGPSGEDTMFKGYYKVYDLKNKAFIDGVEFKRQTYDDVRVSGDLLKIKDENGVSKVYGTDGKVLFDEADGKIKVFDMSNHLVVIENVDDYTCTLYDETGKKVCSHESSIHSITGDAPAYYFNTDNGYEAYDISGKKLSQEALYTINYYNDGVLCVTDENQTKRLINTETGSVIEGSEVTGNYHYCGYGYWTCYNDNGTNTVFTKNGKLGDFDDSNVDDVVITKKTENGEDAFIFDKNDFTVSVANGFMNAQDNIQGLISVYNSDSDARGYDLVSAFSGNKLVEGAEKISASENAVCALKDGSYTLYSLTLAKK